MAQVVNHLPGKCKALNSNTSTDKKRKIERNSPKQLSDDKH
jgi:hypothetical protein